MTADCRTRYAEALLSAFSGAGLFASGPATFELDLIQTSGSATMTLDVKTVPITLVWGAWAFAQRTRNWERGGPDRRESAVFDWETGIVTMHDNKTEVLDNPTFDPMTIMWQFYFTPPTTNEVSFSLATPRRMTRYTVRREETETIENLLTHLVGEVFRQRPLGRVAGNHVREAAQAERLADTDGLIKEAA